MAGLFEGLFGGGQEQQSPEQQARPQSDGMFDRLRATYAPNAYSAHQQSIQQQAVYDAMVKTAGPEMARAMATNPQFFQAANQAFLPGAPQSQVLTDQFGGQSLGQILNKGGGAGHGLEYGGLPIVNPPGTTSSPTQATQGAPAAQQGAPPQDGAQPTNTLQGMPGGVQGLLDKIKANKAAGLPASEGIPTVYQELTDAVLSGKQTIKDISGSSRGKGMGPIVNELALAQDPNFSESQSEARQNARKDYYNSSLGKTGGQIKSFGTVLDHLNTTLDRAIKLDNNDTEINVAPIGGSPGAHLSNWIRGTGGARAQNVNAFDTQRDTLAGETVRFLTGSEGSQKDREAYQEKWGHNDTPRETAGTADAYLKMLLGKANEMKGQMAAQFNNNPQALKDMPVIRAEHEKAIAEIQKKIDFLQNKYKGGTTAPTGAPSRFPPGWSAK